MKYLFLALWLLTTGILATAQQNLSKPISISVSQQRLADVLEIISNQGNFFFSYNSSIIRRDSLVSLQVKDRSVRYALDQLFKDRYEYKETGNFIIIRRKPLQLTIVTKPAQTAERDYAIAGYVLDGESGVKLPDASVYEKDQLISTLSNDDGYFLIRLRSKHPQAALTVSKAFYEDTTVAVNPKMNQELNVTLIPVEVNDVIISPEDYFLPDSVSEKKQVDSAALKAPVSDSNKVEQKFLSKWFVASKQRMQSMNIGNWFAQRPFQLSVTPGLSTHGKMSGQVINNFSLNLFGGYTGGLKGAEVGGLFNINRKDAGYFQVAGLFNHTGGRQAGFQASGLSNSILEYTEGFQAAGISNYNRRWMHGFQAAGVVNFTGAEVHGFQVAGVYNHVGASLSGFQAAGVFNFVNKKAKGVQVAGVLNYTTHLKGVQIGLINISDTSDGYSIGLINVVRKGYHKMYVGADETMDLFAAVKSGNRKLYSSLYGGMNLDPSRKLYSFGYGIGREWVTTKAFALSTDASAHQLYLGSWDYWNLLCRFSLNVHLRATPWLAVFGGASFNMYYSEQPAQIPGYAFEVPRSGYRRFDVGNGWRGWGGWQLGLAFF